MLVKRRLPMSFDVLPEPVIRREIIESFLRAEALLEQAQQQADELLLATERQCQQQLEQSQAVFWEQANRQLQAIGGESAALQREGLSSVERLLSLALSRLLDDTDATQRIRALLRNLSESQAARTTATLSCHPEQASAVRNWLAESQLTALWTVQEDDEVSVEALRLSHAQGALDINWGWLRSGLTGESLRPLSSDGNPPVGTLAWGDATQDQVNKRKSRNDQHQCDTQ